MILPALSIFLLGACADGDAPVDCSKPDADGDGFDNVACDGDDCDDGDPDVNPVQIDNTGDGVDLDCDGVDGIDGDQDGYASDEFGGDDCDDVDADVNPGAADPVGDGVDTSCDGIDGVDTDHDGFASEASGGSDCDDSDADVNPAASDGGAPGNVTVADFWSGSVTTVATDDAGATLIVAGELYMDGSLVQCNVVAAEDSTGVWRTTTVATTTLSGCDFDMARGADGVAHVLYRSDSTTIGYATNEGGTWHSATVTSTLSSWGTAAAVGPDGVYGAWVDAGGAVTVGRLGGAKDSWTVATSASAAVMGLAVDDEVHLLYLTSAGVLMYAHGAPGSEVAEEVARSVLRARLAVGATVQVVYAEGSSSSAAVTWAERAGGAWSAEVVASGVQSVADVSIAVAGDGGSHVAWSDDYYGSDLFYGSRSSDNAWVTTTLVTGAGSDNSMTVDSVGDLHFAHFDGGALMHTTIAGPNGVDDNCDGVVW